MAGDTVITVTGNLTASPELRFTPAGVAVANFTVTSTPRFFDRRANEWRDGDALFLRCNLWREAAENAAESLVMWISKLKSAIYQHVSGMEMSMSSAFGAIAIPAH